MVWGIARLHNPVSWQPATSSTSVALQTGPRHSSHSSRSAGLAMNTTRWMMYGMSFIKNVCTHYLVYCMYLSLNCYHCPARWTLLTHIDHHLWAGRERRAYLLAVRRAQPAGPQLSLVLLGTVVSDCCVRRVPVGMEVPFPSLYFAGHLVHNYSYTHMRTVPAFSHSN